MLNAKSRAKMQQDTEQWMVFKVSRLLAIIRQNEHKTTMLKYIKFSSGHTSEIQETGGKFIRKSGVRAGKT